MHSKQANVLTILRLSICFHHYLIGHWQFEMSFSSFNYQISHLKCVRGIQWKRFFFHNLREYSNENIEHRIDQLLIDSMRMQQMTVSIGRFLNGFGCTFFSLCSRSRNECANICFSMATGPGTGHYLNTTRHCCAVFTYDWVDWQIVVAPRLKMCTHFHSP